MRFPRAAPSRGHRPTVKMAGSHPADAGSTPAVRFPGSGKGCPPLCKSDRSGFESQAPHQLSRIWSRGRVPGFHPGGASSTLAVRTSSFTQRSFKGRIRACHARDGGSSPPRRTTKHEPALWEAARSAKPRDRVRFPAGSPAERFASEALRMGGRLLNGTERVRLPPEALLSAILENMVHASGRGSAWQERLSGGQEIAGSNPAAPTDIESSVISPPSPLGPSPSLGRERAPSSPSASWPRQPDSHSGNAGSTPAGDAGPICRPVLLLGGARLGDRAHQCPSGPRDPSSLPGAPPLPVLLDQAPRFERGRRGSIPRRETDLSQYLPVPKERAPECEPGCSRFESSQGDPCPRSGGISRRRPPKPDDPGSTPGRGSAGRDGPGRGSYPCLRRFDSCPCFPMGGKPPNPPRKSFDLPVGRPKLSRRFTAKGDSHKVGPEGSTPSVATTWVWLNLAERRLREPEIGGSNPPTQTTRDERAGERTGITNRPPQGSIPWSRTTPV